MDYAFWDSSTLVRLCVQRQATPVVQALNAQHRMAVWWSAPVEVRGAFARLIRMGQLTPTEHVQAQVRLDGMRRVWREIDPCETLREQAERLVDRFPLKAADAQQLAAAMAWCGGRAQGCGLISCARQL